MKNTARFLLCLCLPVSSLIWVHSLSAAETIVGYQRISMTPAEDTVAWTDSAKFDSILFEESVAAYGVVTSASGMTITTASNLGADDVFVFADGAQPRHYFVEITSGASQGDVYDITDNTANDLTLETSVSDVNSGDTFKIVAKWSLDLLFPEGADLSASTDVAVGSEVFVFPGDQSFDPLTASKFQYRSDLGNWVDVDAVGVDAGPTAIERGAKVVIRQNSDTPITPIFAGTVGSTGSDPFSVAVNYLQSGLDSFANALSLTGSGSLALDASAASGESGEPQHEGNASTASVWLKYSSSEAGALEIDSNLSDYDTILAVYTGTLGNLQPVASNDDDASFGIASKTVFNVVAGQEYHIALDRKSGSGNAGYLNYVFAAGTVDQPTDFSMSASASAEMNLSWASSGDGVTYRVYRSTDGTFASATMIGTATGTTYQDATTQDGVTYSYWIEAADGIIRSQSTSSLSSRTRSPVAHVANIGSVGSINNASVNTTSDFDGNGVDDLLVQNQISGEIGWWHLDSSGSGAINGGEVLSLNPGAEWQVVNHADFNSDDNPDLLLRNQTSGEVVAWTLNGTELDYETSLPLNDANGSFGAATDWKVAGVASASEEGSFSIASQSSSTGQIAYWEMSSGSAEAPGYQVGLGQLFNTQPTSQNWKLIGLRDFNSDGANDLFWQHQSNGKMAVWFLNDDKNLISASLLTLQTNDPVWEVRGLGDWNGDNKTDISLQNSATGAIVLWYLDGVTYSSSSPVQNPAAGDAWEVRNSDQGQ